MTDSQKGAGAVTDDWTTRRLLGWMTERFEAKGIDAARVVAEMLLAHVLGCERMRLYMEADRSAGPDELKALRSLVQRAALHEPVQYLVGRASFLGRDFLVDGSTMIPQPATEDLVTAVLKCCGADDHEEVGFSTDPDSSPPSGTAAGTEGGVTRRADPEAAIADLGTGSGCIAISLALQMPRARLVATDVIPAALDLARRNADRLGVEDRVDFREGSLMEPLGAEQFDIVCANLPYIPDTEWNGGRVDIAVRDHVPESALRGGSDGLDLIRPVIAGAARHLLPGGHLVLEIANCQRDTVIDLVEQAPQLQGARVEPDYEGLWRVLIAQRA